MLTPAMMISKVINNITPEIIIKIRTGMLKVSLPPSSDFCDTVWNKITKVTIVSWLESCNMNMKDFIDM